LPNEIVAHRARANVSQREAMWRLGPEACDHRFVDSGDAALHAQELAAHVRARCDPKDVLPEG
jgi:hypothetical protein